MVKLDKDERVEWLTNLLLDRDDLNKIEEQPFNVFDVLKISRAEIRHSNVLAWLLDPYGSHGLGSAVLSMLNSYLVQCNLVSQSESIDLLTMDYSDILVYREWRNIDILIESKNAGYVLCIENKIDTQDHNQQLDRYYKIIQETDKFANYKHKIFLYLTPEGLDPNDDKNDVWRCFDYAKIIRILDQVLNKSEVSEDIRKFIDSYCEMLRREIMQDDEIIELCQKIYNKHKKALDLIYENRPDRLQNVSEYFKEWCKTQNSNGNIIWTDVDQKKSTKTLTRFRSNFLDKLSIPTNKDQPSTWNTKTNYYYEITATCNNDGVVNYAIQLVFGLVSLSDEDKEKIEKIYKTLQKNDKNKVSKSGAKDYRIVYRCEYRKVEASAELPENPSDNEIFENLKEMWKELNSVEINNVIVDQFPEK